MIHPLPDPLGLVPLRRLPPAPCSRCDRSAVALGRTGQLLCSEHARAHYGVARRQRQRGRVLDNVVVIGLWRGGAR